MKNKKQKNKKSKEQKNKEWGRAGFRQVVFRLSFRHTNFSI